MPLWQQVKSSFFQSAHTWMGT